MTQCLKTAGLGIEEPIPGISVKQIFLVGAKDTIVAEPTKLRDTHQQQQKQQSLPGSL
jgi:hypothetical protein